MPAMRSCLMVVAVAMAAGASAGAQSPAPCVSGIVSYVGYGVMSKVGSPYSATVKSSFEQKLADGNAIHTVTTSHVARDSAGRTRTEMSIGCAMGKDGQLHPRLQVNVNDPQAKTFMNWQESDDSPKVAWLMHQPDFIPPPTPSEEVVEAQQRATQTQQTERNSHTERLGSKIIDGISAEGTRTVTTIAAGAEGNDLPLEVVREQWRSRELGIILMAINDDPRRGKTTMELEDLNRAEPDPALFAAPAGYTVKEQHPNVDGQ